MWSFGACERMVLELFIVFVEVRFVRYGNPLSIRGKSIFLRVETQIWGVFFVSHEPFEGIILRTW